MYKLDRSYGQHAFDEWNSKKPDDLSYAQTCPKCANSDVWQVGSFRKLIEAVAFLGSMNKRLALFFRGQNCDLDPLPAFFRSSWRPFESKDDPIELTTATRHLLWDGLPVIGQRVYKICRDRDPSRELGLPRWRGLRDIREVQWAIIQHYGLWPTPLLDVSNNLRVAASFAMDFARATPRKPKTGYVYVAGMPHSTGSISYDIDQHVVLARLQSACPPVAKRPHYQDGFLVGRFPLYAPDDKAAKKSSLLRRLVAKFELQDAGKFWDDDFPPIGSAALLPDDDPLRDQFSKEFGRAGSDPIDRRARAILAQR